MIRDFVTDYLDGVRAALERINLDKFELLIALLLEAYQAHNQIFVMGNGGSAATASHFACDINKSVSFSLARKFKVICLNDNIPTVLAYANDNSYDDIFAEQLKNFLKPNDVVIGVSGSGNSKNVIRAVEYANHSGGKSVGLTGFDGGRLAEVAGLSIVVHADDMQKVEDVHLVLTHMIMQILFQKLEEAEEN